MAGSDIFDELDEILKTFDSNRDKFDRYENFRSRIELAYLAEAVSSRNGDKAAIKLHNMLVNQSFANNPQVISDFFRTFSQKTFLSNRRALCTQKRSIAYSSDYLMKNRY